MCTNLGAQTPPVKPQFEVASVKPAANPAGIGSVPMMREMMRTGRPPGQIPMKNPGRISLENWALLDLIAAAYGVRATQVSGPSWLADQDFDLEAKVPVGTPKEDLNAMLQTLLEERFGLQVHRDTRTLPGFALVVGKRGPNLKPAELPPAAAPDLTEEERKAKLKEQSQKGMAEVMERMRENRENGTPLGAFNTASWPSLTMDELAARLLRFVDAPVVDETGLPGFIAST
jgi:uncharacterized protein (TIGR03435 family)